MKARFNILNYLYFQILKSSIFNSGKARHHSSVIDDCPISMTLYPQHFEEVYVSGWFM